MTMPTGFEEFATKTDLRLLEEKVDLRFTGLEQRLDKRFERIDERFEQMDQRLEQMDQRFERIDQRFERIDERFGTLDGRWVEVHEVLHSQTDRYLKWLGYQTAFLGLVVTLVLALANV